MMAAPATKASGAKQETASLYQDPTRRLFGNGSFDQLPAVLADLKPKSILLVLGQKSFRASAYFSKLQEMLEPYQVLETAAVPQNPTQIFVQEGIDRLKGQSFDVTLAIGGGSVLDTAKLWNVISRQPVTDLAAYMDRTPPIAVRAPVLITLPTTAGTGSEVTPYASLETREKKKITIGHPALYPSIAIIDPEMTYSMPAYVSASTGFDAVSQAIESFWSVHATPFSQTHSLRALELMMRHLKTVVAAPSDAEARAAMSLGSCEAGLAIAHTKTTAVHSVSYPITAHFSVAHGHACALTLSSFIRFNAPVMKEAGLPLCRAAGARDYDDMANQIDALMDQVRLERKLSGLGIREDGIKLILRDGFRPDRIKNNPRPVTREDLQKILNQIR